MNLKKSLVLFLKGMAMGAADVVPGVSGGTIALISGIYPKLLDAISNIKPSLLSELSNKGFAFVAEKIHLKFLITLFAGIFASVLTLAKGISYLLEFHPILIWSFFLGLILGSIVLMVKQIKGKRSLVIIAGLLGMLLAAGVSFLPVGEDTSTLPYLFLSGALAICAMILPGISGSFILVILGSYEPILQAVHQRDLKTIAVVGAGAIIGLLSFARILKWFFHRYPNATLALMTGFIAGSIPAVWPWKDNASGSLYLPSLGLDSDQLLIAILLSLSGLLLIIGLEKASKLENTN
jgi:putative membrane protein